MVLCYMTVPFRLTIKVIVKSPFYAKTTVQIPIKLTTKHPKISRLTLSKTQTMLNQ